MCTRARAHTYIFLNFFCLFTLVFLLNTSDGAQCTQVVHVYLSFFFLITIIIIKYHNCESRQLLHKCWQRLTEVGIACYNKYKCRDNSFSEKKIINL